MQRCALAVEEVPVAALVGIDPTGPGAVEGGAVAADADVSEPRGDVAVEAAVGQDVDLVAVPVAEPAVRVAELSAAGDDDPAPTPPLEGDQPVDAAAPDALERRAAE